MFLNLRQSVFFVSKMAGLQAASNSPLNSWVHTSKDEMVNLKKPAERSSTHKETPSNAKHQNPLSNHRHVPKSASKMIPAGTRAASHLRGNFTNAWLAVTAICSHFCFFITLSIRSLFPPLRVNYYRAAITCKLLLQRYKDKYAFSTGLNISTGSEQRETAQSEKFLGK